MLENIFDYIINNIEAVASALPPVIIIGDYGSTSSGSANGWAAVSAISAFATSIWAICSWKVAWELKKIEENRADREGTKLFLYKDHPYDDPDVFGELFNKGLFPTKIKSALICKKDSCINTDNPNVVCITHTECKDGIIASGGTIKLLIDNRTYLRATTPADWINGNYLLVVKALHQRGPIFIEINTGHQIAPPKKIFSKYLAIRSLIVWLRNSFRLRA